jgi:short-subunit dehydrogenase
MKTVDDQPVALVTGASRGIGAATARELARRGYALVLVARSARALELLAGELGGFGCRVLPVPADLQEPAAPAQISRLAFAHFGRVDVLVNNAGIGSPGAMVAELSDQDIHTRVATNLVGPIALTRALLPPMIARRSGSIIFVASVASHIVLPSAAIYSATKSGLRSFALGLRREVMQHGVGVSVISPGFIDTDMTRSLTHVPKAAPELVARAIAAAIAHPRREVFVPSYYRLLAWVDRALPGVLDSVAPRASFMRI